MIKLSENETINPAMTLEGVILATGSGSYYSEIVFEDIFSNYSFIENNFIVNVSAEINLTYTGNKLSNVIIPRGNLEACTNPLPIELIEISDENTTYTQSSNWTNLIIDKLPMVIKIDLTELIQSGVIEETIKGGLVIDSSNKIRGYVGYVEDGTLIVHVNSLEVGGWNGIVEISGFNVSNQTNMTNIIRGVSQIFNFTVTDSVPLFEPHFFTNLSEFINPDEFDKMNNATRYTKHILYSDLGILNPELTDFGFEKEMNVSSDLNRLEIVSIQYDTLTNTTNLKLVVESSVNISNVSIVVNATRFDEKYSYWIDLESIEENMGMLEEGAPKEINISINGRYGTDFNKLDCTVTKHSVAT